MKSNKEKWNDSENATKILYTFAMQFDN